MRILLATESYLPYLSGVTVSVDALARGLGGRGRRKGRAGDGDVQGQVALLPALERGGGEQAVVELEGAVGGALGVVVVADAQLPARAVGIEQQGVERVASGRQKGAAPGVLARIPAELAIPGADTVVIVDLAVMEFSEQAFIDDGFGGEELARKAAFKTDAGFYPRLLDGLLHGAQVLQ